MQLKTHPESSLRKAARVVGAIISLLVLLALRVLLWPLRLVCALIFPWALLEFELFRSSRWIKGTLTLEQKAVLLRKLAVQWTLIVVLGVLAIFVVSESFLRYLKLSAS